MKNEFSFSKRFLEDFKGLRRSGTLLTGSGEVWDYFTVM